MDFSSSSPSKGTEKKDEHDLLGSLGGGGTSSITRPIDVGGHHFEEDLMREFNQKASEFSTFLDESHPIPVTTASGTLGVDLLATSTSEKSSTDTSPNPPNLSTQAQFMEAMSGSSGMSSGDFDLIGDFKSAGGDSKITEELMAAAREFGEGSPTALDMGFEQVHGDKQKEQQHHDHGFSGDQKVPPTDTFGRETDFHYTQSEPMMNFGMAKERTESPKLPDEPCFKPSPEPVHSFGPHISQHSVGEISSSAHFDEYTRRETMPFEEEKGTTFGMNLKADIPPPIPKHAYEINKDSPPPVPKHADDYSFKREPPFIHATYDDKIDDEFDDDSLSRPLSHKLSDSLEVLKESPQKEMQLDESLMDLEELSSSKSISPNAHGGGGIPPEMMESTLFSQQPPASFQMDDEIMNDERFGFTHVSHEVESKPTASIPPFPNQSAKKDDIQAPKFYESEDSSSSKGKDSISSSGYDKKELFPEAISTPEHVSKVEVKPIPKTEVTPTKVEKKEETPKKVVEKPKPREAPPKPPTTRHTLQVIDNSDFKISEDVIQILNTFNPKLTMNAEFDNKSTNGSNSPFSDMGAGDLMEKSPTPSLASVMCPRAWFDPAKLHPTVSELVYWRDPKKSGAAFGALFVVLIALSCLSLISVVAYTSLVVLSGTFAFRVYKAVLAAVQKTNEGHPFKEFLDLDITFSGEKAQELSNAIINYANTALLKLRRLFLVEDFVDSAKFGVFLYVLTYIGGWFNGLTLIILGTVALFSLPKVYETNKTVIDQYIDLVLGKLSEINAKITAAVPFLKKDKAQ